MNGDNSRSHLTRGPFPAPCQAHSRLGVRSCSPTPRPQVGRRGCPHTHACLPLTLCSPAAGGGALGGGGGGSQAWRLYRGTHCADCELRLSGHDVCGLDVAVVHRVLEGGPNVCVLMASIAIERNFGSSPGNERVSDQADRETKSGSEGGERGHGRLHPPCRRPQEGCGLWPPPSLRYLCLYRYSTKPAMMRAMKGTRIAAATELLLEAKWRPMDSGSDSSSLRSAKSQSGKLRSQRHRYVRGQPPGPVWRWVRRSSPADQTRQLPPATCCLSPAEDAPHMLVRSHPEDRVPSQGGQSVGEPKATSHDKIFKGCCLHKF